MDAFVESSITKYILLQSIEQQAETSSSRLKSTKMVNLALHTQKISPSSSTCDLSFFSSFSSPEDLLQEFELQIMNIVNQDVQTLRR